MCTFVAATIPVEHPGDASPAMEAAQAIGTTPEQAERQTTTPEPQAGSYEKFVATFGRAMTR